MTNLKVHEAKNSNLLYGCFFTEPNVTAKQAAATVGENKRSKSPPLPLLLANDVLFKEELCAFHRLCILERNAWCKCPNFQIDQLKS